MIRVKRNGVVLSGSLKEALAKHVAVTKAVEVENLSTRVVTQLKEALAKNVVLPKAVDHKHVSARVVSQLKEEQDFSVAIRQLAHEYDLTSILECHEDSIEVLKQDETSATLRFHLSLSAKPEANVFRRRLVELLSQKWKPGFFALVADNERQMAHSIFGCSPFPDTRAFKASRILALVDTFVANEGDASTVARCEGVAFGISDADWHLYMEDLFKFSSSSAREDCGIGLVPQGSKEMVVTGEVHMSDGSPGPTMRASIWRYGFGVCPERKDVQTACFMYFSQLRPGLEPFYADVTVPLDKIDEMEEVTWQLEWAEGNGWFEKGSSGNR